MSFLNNSGDIILDAVLTDTGRKRIARGDGSFEIAKFAFGDDEIDYNKYDKNHPSGSSHFDLEVLKTPVFEAVTDNTSALKNRMTSIPRNDLLYLPVLRINEQDGLSRRDTGNASGSYVVAVDDDTEDILSGSGQGTMHGVTFQNRPNEQTMIDQGLDTQEVSPSRKLDSSLVETQYIVEIDSRLGDIISKDGDAADISYIDDDSIASYFLTLGTDPEFVSDGLLGNDDANASVIPGPRGTRLEFKVAASLDLENSDFLFNELGGTSTFNSQNVKHIDTTIQVTGGSTGWSIDIPFRFIKLDN